MKKLMIIFILVVFAFNTAYATETSNAQNGAITLSKEQEKELSRELHFSRLPSGFSAWATTIDGKVFLNRRSQNEIPSDLFKNAYAWYESNESLTLISQEERETLAAKARKRELLNRALELAPYAFGGILLFGLALTYKRKVKPFLKTLSEIEMAKLIGVSFLALIVILKELEPEAGIYMLLRIVITIFSLWTAKDYYDKGFKFGVWAFSFISILFNPLFIVSFEKETWGIIDIVTALAFLVSMYFERRKKNAT